jgi:Tat protein translocase TatB subunit
MFDFSFAELALIVVVAVVFIGPKELPVVRAVSKALRSMRGLSREVRGAFDDLTRESGLKETADQFHHEIRMIKGEDGRMYEAYELPRAKVEKVSDDIAS